MRQSKLGIIGVGHVGKAVLTNLLRTHFFDEYVLIDTREERVFGEALDQVHATGSLAHHNFKIYQGHYDDLKDADMVIIAANHYYGDGVLPQLDRQKLLEDNIPELHQIMTGIMQATQDAILIFISNPVDTWTQLAITEYGYPERLCMGTGTMLDTARLKYSIARHYEVDPKSVSAYMMGEHGESAFAVLSHASIAGMAYDQLASYFPDKSVLDLDQLNAEIIEAANIIYKNKLGVTDSGIAVVCLELVTSIMLNEHSIHPLTSLHPAGTYGLDRDLCYGLPTKVGSQGIEGRYPIELNEWEAEKLQASFQVIAESVDRGRALLRKLQGKEA